ncbi:MAG: glycoside hydrolase family 127 protein [Oscillospiraceae bacterium]|nr:glycoside hydrolase family 127 protein [Oscillospiraceae bacterium]
MLKTAQNGSVTILPGVFRERMDVNRSYLLELDSNCLLQNFYLEAGVILPGLQVVDDPEKSKLHWGWEAPTCQLRGHFLGHWLSAAAKLVAFENDMELKVKLDRIVSELARCQELNGGEWIGSIPEKYFTRLINDQYIWSPQYTLHKTIMGLTHAYTYAGNRQALDILSHLSDWYIRWTEKAAQTNPHAVYSGEEAGMLEVWAELYQLTCDERYMTLAKRYSDVGLFRTLREGRDGLTNCHANASIPFTHGAAKLYEITGDQQWLDILKQFWKCAVTDRGMFCTSGMNAGEFWVPPFMQGHFLGSNDQEFCTVYNMVRTASYLYKFTGEAQYADYIERCLYNGFLAQQNPHTGMPTYFLPLNAGSRKKWGTKTRDFWCCHGTMVQAQTLYPELIYFSEESRVIIAQYIPSRYETEISGARVTVEQTTGMKYYNDQAFFDEKDDGQMSRWLMKFTVSCDNPARFTLSLRVPEWIRSEPEITLDGERITVPIKDGYLEITADWHNSALQVYFPAGLRTEALPDIPELAAVVDGPVVLAGLTGSDCGIVGLDSPQEVFVPQYEHTYGTFPWRQNSWRTRNQPQSVMFRPLYEITDEEYTVYFTKKN